MATARRLPPEVWAGGRAGRRPPQDGGNPGGRASGAGPAGRGGAAGSSGAAGWTRRTRTGSFPPPLLSSPAGGLMAEGSGSRWRDRVRAREGGEPEAPERALLPRLSGGVGGKTRPSLCAGTELERREAAPAPTAGWDVAGVGLWTPSPDPPSQGRGPGSGAAEAAGPLGAGRSVRARPAASTQTSRQRVGRIGGETPPGCRSGLGGKLS
uniref:Uncharacterized protein n=1 Tax=Myotis myotis TaxID=51298 RepID=A0A7J7VZC9_MYOMY|nr:hypothetical protein mMyoMyo1_012340 [Myotis myotis]